MTSFKELGIKKSLKYLEESGFTEPFPIQAEAIPILLKGKDMIGQAQTGTGKTAAFGLPILEGIDENEENTQALVIVPTRELAMQVAEEIRKFSGGTAKVTAVYGGQKMMAQIKYLRTHRQIVVATPGRMLDYIQDDALPLNKVRFVVLDEADRMLDMGFIEDVKKILKNIPNRKQTSMFSATMPKEIVKLTEKFLNNPERVIVSKDEISNVDIKQFYMDVSERDKMNQLCNFLKQEKKTIVFCATKMRVKRLAEDLYKRGFEVDAIHGDMEQPQRTRVIGDFKSHRSNILIATDVVSRGIDVPYVDRVVSYDVPMDKLAYFHRIGRTARAGEKGDAIIFVTPSYFKDFKEITRETKIDIKRMQIGKVKDFPVVRGVDNRRFGTPPSRFAQQRGFSRPSPFRNRSHGDGHMKRGRSTGRKGASRGQRKYSSRR